MAQHTVSNRDPMLVLEGWDEPTGCTTERGWLFRPSKVDEYGYPTEQGGYTVWDGQGEVYRITVGHYCAAKQPPRPELTVHAVALPRHGSIHARYFHTSADAKTWIESVIAAYN